MQHRFQHICYDPVKLLDGCNKLSTFVSRINKQAEEDHGMGWTSDEYKGFAFEALIEALIASSPIDKRINIKNYRPHSNKTDGRDMGIDGYGESHNGKLHTVQIKFRSDCTTDLTTKDGISNFVAHTRVHPVYKDAEMTVFTTAKDLHNVIAEDMYQGQVRTVGYNELRKLLDNNEAFWNIFRQQLTKPKS